MTANRGYAELLKEPVPRKLIPPLAGALIKNGDVRLFERLAFMSRRKERE